MSTPLKLKGTEGVVFPVLTTTEKNAIVLPDTGSVVFDSTLGALSVYNGTIWKTVTTS